MVAIVRVPVTDFSPERLDTGFYSKEFYAARAQIAKSGLSLEPIGAVCEPWQFGAYALCNDIVWSNEKDGIPFFKAEAIESPLVKESALSYVTKATHSLLSKSALKAGDIIMSTSGTVGRLAVLPDSIPTANSNQDTIKFSLSGTSYDSHFVAAWLISRYAQAFMNREAGGAVQQHIYLYNFKRLPLLKISPTAQQYIGDKVRQAERLRAWAKDLRSSVDKVLDQLGLPIAEEPAMISHVSTERLEARLDPRPYRTHYINLVDQIKGIKHSYVSDITELNSGCPVSSSDFIIEGGEVPLVRIRNIGYDEFIDLDTGVTNELHKEEAKYQAKENMIVLGMDGIFRAQFFLSDELPMLVNQRVGMLTATDIRPELLTHWMNRPEGQMQLNQWAVKTTVEHTSLSDIGRVCIPRLDAGIEGDLADKLLSARRAYRYSRFLTICAKLLVEDLIEGQITEAQLIAAEQALQAGNDALDRKILGRLKTDGIDGEGAALFSDLDELYRLLALAEVE